jgi:PAN domain
MYCSSTNNSGFIQLVGPIQQQDLATISIATYPVSTSFAPRTTAPSLVGNRINESTENTCTYKSIKYSLVDVQICAPIHKGFVLPGKKDAAVAELVLAFSGRDLGIIMAVPIYNSGELNANEYLDQLLDTTMASCNYTTAPGSDYNGESYQENPSTSLTQCVKTCCNDTKCLAYTFKSGKCHLKDAVQPVNNTGDNSIVSGTVNHAALQCNGITNATKISTLESIFVNQPSFAYKTCFETSTSRISSTNSLYVIVFPNGIHMTPSNYQQLLLQLNGSLSPYTIPPSIRGGDPTLQSYTLDNAKKSPSQWSADGVIYSTSIASCSEEFKHRFEFFTMPLRAPRKEAFVSLRSVEGFVGSTSNGQCKPTVPYKCAYRKIDELKNESVSSQKGYKCMPLDQQREHDSTNTYVIPTKDTPTIYDIVKKATEIKENEKTLVDTLSTEEKEKLGAYVIGGTMIIVGLAAVILINTK